MKMFQFKQKSHPVPVNNPHLADVVERNIAKIEELRKQEDDKRTLQDRIADGLTDFSGSMIFVYIHLIWFGVWIVLNTNILPIKAFDPFPFGFLTLVVSLEAIFLSTFVLISQNRASSVSDRRSDLDLQINLLSEHEITRLIVLVDAIADHLGVTEGQCDEIEELKKEVPPETVLEELKEHKWNKK